MAKEQLVDITIEEDGTVKIDQVGYEGKACETDPLLQALKKAVGTVQKQSRKSDYFKEQKVRINAQTKG